MMRDFCLGLMVGISLVTLQAASHTVTLTGAQEAGAAAQVALINAQRAAETPPRAAITVGQLLQQVVDTFAGGWVRAATDVHGTRASDELKDLMAVATPAKRDAAMAAAKAALR